MSSITSYKTTAFKESQKFLVIDPSTQSPSLVLGSDLVSYITPMLNYVRADSTRLSAENTDYDVGTLVQTSGATSPGDNFAATYLVVEGGSGDFPMLNGNDLLVIKGDEFLREQLASSDVGDGSDLVAHTGTSDTVTEALDKRTVFVDNVKDLIAISSPLSGSHYSVASYHPGWNASMVAPVGGGEFIWDENEPKSSHTGGTVIDPDKTFPSDWSNATQVSDWFTADGAGNGCFIKLGNSFNQNDFGAGTGDAAKDGAAIEQAFNTLSHVECTESRDYFLEKEIFVLSDVSISGAKSNIYCSFGGRIQFVGSNGVITPVSILNDVPYGSNFLSGDYTADFSEGDLIFIQRTDDFSFALYRDYYRTTDIVKIRSIDASGITLYETLDFAYPAASSQISALNPISVDWQQMNIYDNNAGVTVPLRFRYCDGVSVVDSTIKGGANSALMFDTCNDCRLSRSVIDNFSTINTSLNYGVYIAQSKNVVIDEKCDIHGFRHSVAVTSTDGICRDIVIKDSTLKNNYELSLVYNADVHGGAKNVTYINNVIYNGFGFGGENITFRKNSVVAPRDDYPAINIVAMVRGKFDITDNDIIMPDGNTNVRVIRATNGSQYGLVSDSYILDFSRNRIRLNSNQTFVFMAGAHGDRPTVKPTFIVEDNDLYGDTSGLLGNFDYTGLEGAANEVAPSPKEIKLAGDFSEFSSSFIMLRRLRGDFEGTTITFPEDTEVLDDLTINNGEYQELREFTLPYTPYAEIAGPIDAERPGLVQMPALSSLYRDAVTPGNEQPVSLAVVPYLTNNLRVWVSLSDPTGVTYQHTVIARFGGPVKVGPR